jgi:superfamily II DNA or RNA helicase
MKTLRQYQRDAVSAFFNTEDRHATLKMFTGSGKTLVAVNIVRELRARLHGDLSVLFVTPTIDLKDQSRRVFEQEGFTYDEVPEIVTYAMAAKHVDKVEARKYDLIIFDEMHHLGDAPVFGRLLVPALSAPYALGLSATPPEEADNLALRVMPVVYERTYRQGLDEGYAAPFKVVQHAVQLTDQEYEAYRHLTSMISEMIAVYGVNYQNRPWLGPTYPPLQGEDPSAKRIWGGTITNARRQLAALAEEKYAELERLLTEVLKLYQQVPDDGPRRRILVWSEYVAALEKAKETLNHNGPIAELVTGTTPKKERRRLLTEAWGHDFPILLVAKIGEEGIDYPECDTGVILAGAKTSRQNIQRVGRLLRPLPGKEAAIHVIYARGTTDTRILPLLAEIGEPSNTPVDKEEM